jgi:multimeric flavodoxin WrbA
MKVIAFNGSPRPNGNTSILINTVFGILKAEGIETEMVNVATKPVRVCPACGKCWELRGRHCAITNDSLNDWLDKMCEADGIILGSPVYCADLTGQMKSFIDRASMTACANDSMLQRKLGAAVVAVRRSGEVHTFHSLNSFFTILQMIIVGSSYWNNGFGLEPGDVVRDEEGMNTMKNLGRNMAWLLKSIKKAGLAPPATTMLSEYRSLTSEK